MAKKIIAKTKIMRKKGCLYYVAFDPEGYLMIGEAVLSRNGRTSGVPPPLPLNKNPPKE